MTGEGVGGSTHPSATVAVVVGERAFTPVAPTVIRPSPITLHKYIPAADRGNAVLTWVLPESYFRETMYPLIAGGATMAALTYGGIAQGGGATGIMRASATAVPISVIMAVVAAVIARQRRGRGASRFQKIMAGQSSGGAGMYAWRTARIIAVTGVLAGLVVWSGVLSLGVTENYAIESVLTRRVAFTTFVSQVYDYFSKLTIPEVDQGNFIAQATRWVMETAFGRTVFKTANASSIVLPFIATIVRMFQAGSLATTAVEAANGALWAATLYYGNPVLFFFAHGLQAGRGAGAGVENLRDLPIFGEPSTSASEIASGTWSTLAKGKGLVTAMLPTSFVGKVVGAVGLTAAGASVGMASPAILAGLAGTYAVSYVAGVVVGVAYAITVEPYIDVWWEGKLPDTGVPLYDTQDNFNSPNKVTEINGVVERCEEAFMGMNLALFNITNAIQDLEWRGTVKASDIDSVCPDLVIAKTSAFSSENCNSYLQGVCTRFMYGRPVTTAKGLLQFDNDGSVLLQPNKFKVVTTPADEKLETDAAAVVFNAAADFAARNKMPPPSAKDKVTFVAMERITGTDDIPGMFSATMVARILADVMTPCVLAGAVLVQILDCMDGRKQLVTDLLNESTNFQPGSEPNLHLLQDTLARMLILTRTATMLALSVQNLLVDKFDAVAVIAGPERIRYGGYGFATYLQELTNLLQQGTPAIDSRAPLTRLWTATYALNMRFDSSKPFENFYLPTVYFVLVTSLENILGNISNFVSTIATSGFVKIQAASIPNNAAAAEMKSVQTELLDALHLLERYRRIISQIQIVLHELGKPQLSYEGSGSHPVFRDENIRDFLRVFTEMFVNDTISSAANDRFWTSKAVKAFPHVACQPKEISRAERRCNVAVPDILARNPTWHQHIPLVPTTEQSDRTYTPLNPKPASVVRQVLQKIIHTDTERLSSNIRGSSS